MTNKSKVTKEDVEKIAELSKLKLSETEIADFSKIFTDTLSYIDVLEELDVSNTTETFNVTGLSNVYQKGEKDQTTLTKEEALSNASERVGDLFATTGVFE